MTFETDKPPVITELERSYQSDLYFIVKIKGLILIVCYSTME